jgi:hypothetical protein
MFLLFNKYDNSLALLLKWEEDFTAIQNIAKYADPGDVPEASKRLYQDPVSKDEPDAGTTQEDWQEIVIPELKEEFSAAIATVMDDVKKMAETEIPLLPPANEGEEEPEPIKVAAKLIRIPMDHAQDWYSALNQARLMMVEKSLYIDDEGEAQGKEEDVYAYERFTSIQGHLLAILDDTPEE